MSVESAVEQLAERKARALVQNPRFAGAKDCLILSADTIVDFQGEILGKPKDQEEAFLTLKKLSGNIHRVITAYCLLHTTENKAVTGHSTSQVEFRRISDEEIWDYVRSGDPMDKAGSYGIQSLARGFIAQNNLQLSEAKEKELGSTFRMQGDDFVKNFTGSLENIAGLPVEDVEKLASQWGWVLPKKGIADADSE